MKCSSCETEYNEINEYNIHLKVCIYYLYNSKYSKKINNGLIKNIVNIINILNIYNKNIDYIFSKNDIIKNIELEYSINKSFTILDGSIDNTKIEYLYNYLYTYFKKSNIELYNYNDIINIIANLFHISNNDIINIINCYKISYSNCEL